MKNICLEMPVIAKCLVNECAYNDDKNCHARAITVGDSRQPQCDTFMKGSHHVRQIQQIAGIGACKTAICKYNDDLECIADAVQVGMVKNAANCMTFALR